MKEYMKKIYVCFCSFVLIVVLFFSIFINKKITEQNKIIDKTQNELSYILQLNDEIEKNNSNLEQLKKRDQQITNLKSEQEVLTAKLNELQISINKYNQLNTDLENKIKYYE